MSLNIKLRKDGNFITDLYQDDIKNALKEATTKPRSEANAWPSEALCQLGPLAVGECKRSLFYRIIGVQPTEPMTVKGHSTCDAGSMYEEYHINRFRSAGILKNEQVLINFVLPGTHNNVKISGRMDCIISSGGTNYSIEIKSVSDFRAIKVMGTMGGLPLPSPGNLMQAMLYKYYLKNTEAGQKLDIDHVYLMYINRGNGSTLFYEVDLDEEGWPVVTTYSQTGKELSTVKLKDQQSFDDLLTKEGIATNDESRYAELRINTQDIFDKFDVVYDYVGQKSIPPCDYSIAYSEAEMNREYKIGRLSKTKYNRYTKHGETEGDGRCKYCSYRTKCLEDSGVVLNQPG